MSTASIALNRFGLGARPDESPPADSRGWLLNQFARYEALPAPWAAQPRTGVQLAQYLADQRAVRTASEDSKPAARQMLRRDARDDYLGAVGARVASTLDTPAPFVERLVHFWSNHFAVSIDKQSVVNLAGAFEADAIRPHVLGKFEDMLLAAVRHPAMLLYLDQANSVGPESPAGRRAAVRDPARRRGLNENLAREILELHTLGVRSGYTQADVSEFARALTGWSIAGGPAGNAPVQNPDNVFQFIAGIHEPGSRTVLGRAYPQEGEAQALAILRQLAGTQATARHIATKLARHFVADEPPPAVVHRLAVAFENSGGHLPTLYRALIDSPEAWQIQTPKFKTPWEWAVSGLRGLGRRDLPGMQMAALMTQLGQPVWRPGSPAGFDDIAASWAAPDALVRRVEAAHRMATQAGDAIDARALAPRLLPGALGEATAGAIARAESPASGLALLLVSPEFLRR
jgi:uncharacterized protein (DUF1800 family)